ncbi:hypothetical protein BpHYR1_009604 [Brachionus plicatilis]|uniref:Uncharacterized protein n=1 Tax=Brachionus plicatilis TaxID=10195 RepID=A0A3M7T5I9_BRAPC|nr:hypothetical protein BpHYR1_009604 [Brachionus plicatilis]
MTSTKREHHTHIANVCQNYQLDIILPNVSKINFVSLKELTFINQFYNLTRQNRPRKKKQQKAFFYRNITKPNFFIEKIFFFREAMT